MMIHRPATRCCHLWFLVLCLVVLVSLADQLTCYAEGERTMPGLNTSGQQEVITTTLLEFHAGVLVTESGSLTVGKRIVIQDGRGSAVDLNEIPFPCQARVTIVRLKDILPLCLAITLL